MTWHKHLLASVWIHAALCSTRCQAMPTTATTVSTTDITVSSNISCNSTTPAYDAEGAMKFTVAVVLVFGVGVIGLLGIYHHRNINEDLTAKETDAFVKRLERKRSHLDKQYRKKLMLQLVDSIFSSRLRTERQRHDVKSFLRPTLSEPNLLQTTSLLSDCSHNQHHVLLTQSQGDQNGQNQPTEGLLEPLADPRSRSKSFHVPDERNIYQKRLKAVQQIKLQMKKPLLRDDLKSTDGERCVEGHDQMLPAQTHCQRSASPPPPTWRSGYDKVGRSTGDPQHDSPPLGGHRQQVESPRPERLHGIDVRLGSELLLPIIKVNDVLVT